MDQNTELEAKISEEETKTTKTMDLGGIPPIPTGIALQGQFYHIETTVQATEDHMINAQINHSLEKMEINLEMNLSTIRTEAGETMEDFLLLHRLKGETSHNTLHTANQEVSSLTTLLSPDLTIDLRLVSRTMNKSFRKKKFRRHFVWFVSTTTDDTINELSDFCPLNY